MIDYINLKKVLMNFISIIASIVISICFCITILHAIFLRYDYIKLKNNQPPAFSLTREYYTDTEECNAELAYEPQCMYYGLGYNLVPKNEKENKNSFSVESYFGFGLIDKYIINGG